MRYKTDTATVRTKGWHRWNWWAWTGWRA